MDHHSTTGATTTTSRAEAERLLGIAEKLLHTRDLTGSREFALLAQETEPLLEGSDQILAITDVLLASETRVVNNNNNSRHHDCYSILQINPNSDIDLVKKNYRRLALLLHPDKNKFPLSDTAFKLVADSWAILSDPSRRNRYDHDLNVFSKVDLRPTQFQPTHQHQQKEKDKDKDKDKDKLPVRRSYKGDVESNNKHTNNNDKTKILSFWTACPYCYVLYEFDRIYEECCVRCQNCERAFHASVISSLPPLVPGKEAYYCCWGFFPLGFSLSKEDDEQTHQPVNGIGNNNVHVNNNNGTTTATTTANNNMNSGFPNWMPGMFTVPSGGAPGVNMNVSSGGGGGIEATDGSDSGNLMNNNRTRNISGGFNYTPPGMPVPGQKKRGRPRKNPLPV